VPPKRPKTAAGPAPLVQLALFAEEANLARVYPEENMWRFYRMEIWPDLLGLPQVVGLLHRQPDAGAVAAQLPQPEGHLRRYGGFLAQDAMEHLPGDVQVLRGVSDREAKRGQHVFPQKRPRMARAPGRGTRNHDFIVHAFAPQ
jgi:hypothetical protein